MNTSINCTNYNLLSKTEGTEICFSDIPSCIIEKIELHRNYLASCLIRDLNCSEHEHVKLNFRNFKNRPSRDEGGSH